MIAASSVHAAAVSADARFMRDEERPVLFENLRAIHPDSVGNLEEEVVIPYHNGRERLKQAGVRVD